jgi:hypothetical protein
MYEKHDTCLSHPRQAALRRREHPLVHQAECAQKSHFFCACFSLHVQLHLYGYLMVSVSASYEVRGENESAPSIAPSFSLFFSFFRLFFRSSVSSTASSRSPMTSVLSLRFLLTFLWEGMGSMSMVIARGNRYYIILISLHRGCTTSIFYVDPPSFSHLLPFTFLRHAATSL